MRRLPYIPALFFASFLFLSCYDAERDNPCDEEAINYNEDVCLELLGLTPSSSSLLTPVSSSSVASYAYCIIDGMCLNGPYSYSECFDNLKGLPSNNCVLAPSSSSSTPPISSSVPPSSSSVVPSSSSIAPSSSSLGGGFSGSYGSLYYEGQTYKTVVIGTQTWMAENLNYNASGSRCYGDNSGGDSQNRCGTYGRLYNWVTAMGFESSCTSASCSSQIQSKHKGICPSGWHIPSDAEWTTLTSYVGSNAGTKLKAKNGWSSCGPSGSGSSYSCEDTFGFSALPGGGGYSDGSLGNVGDDGFWWSATESNADYAYHRSMAYRRDVVYYDNYNKSYLFSVRCLQD